MKKTILFRLVVSVMIVSALYSFTVRKPLFADRILVFSKTAAFHHNSIAVANPALVKLGQENKIDVDTTVDAGVFTADNLKKYKAVIFLNTTGDVLNDEQQAAFEQYIKKGGGFVGIHAATDCEYNWPWYGNLVGAYFGSHPAVQEATLKVVDQSHASTKGLPAEWKRRDEWYDFKWMADNLKVLITIDESSYKGGKMNGNHPMAWYHAYDGGRAFYTEFGHTNESYADPLYLAHVLGGIRYAMGAK